MNNSEIAEILDQTARLLELRQGDSLPVEELRDLAFRVARLEVPLELFENASARSEEVRELERVFSYWFAGFSFESSQVFFETVLTGSSQIRDRLLSETPLPIQDLLKIKSLAVQDVLNIRERFGVFDVYALREACKQGIFSSSNFFSESEELDVLEDVYKFEKQISNGRISNGSDVKTTVDPFLASASLEDEPPIDGESTIFHANADALADFIIDEIQRSKITLKSVAEDLTSEKTLESVKRATRSAFDGVKKFFVSRNSESYMRIKMREDADRAASLRRQNTESERTRQAEENVNAPLNVVKVGALGRGKEALSRLDFLIETDDAQKVFERIKRTGLIREVLAETTNFLSAKLNPSAFVMPYNARPTPEATLNFYASIGFVWGAREIFLTSSKKHLEFLNKRASERGLTLSPFGLYRGVQRASSRTTERIYDKLGLPPIPAELREGAVETDWIQAGRPERIQLEDLRGDLHLHTSFSDGTEGVEEMATVAFHNGLSYIAATDHTKSVPYVAGLDDSQVLRYWEVIDEVNERLRKSGFAFRVFKGVEVDILDDGSLDLTDETLSKAEWVVASIHSNRNRSFSDIERRYLGAFRNPYVDVIAHPTGRVIGREAPLNLDLDFLCENAQKYDKLLELNSQPRRLDLSFEGLVLAKKRNVTVAISTDSHSPEQLIYLRFGVQLARRAGLTSADVVNALSLEDFESFLSKRKSRRV